MKLAYTRATFLNCLLKATESVSQKQEYVEKTLRHIYLIHTSLMCT